LTKRCSEVEDLLRNAQCKTLLHEVYKEIDELDRQAVNGAAKQGDVPQEVRLSREELASSLQILRVAILFMEEVFFTLNLEIQYTHPVNLGWINYFARWAYAPLFRMWWPLLKPMFAARFTRFFEDRFSLARLEDPPSAVEDVTGTIGEGERGFAWACWLAERKPGDAPPKDRTVMSYKLAMRYRDKEVYKVQAALLLVHVDPDMALWDAEDLYVPPGLWGAGIGEAFLQEIERVLKGRGVKRLVVRLSISPLDLVAHKKSADAAQLYRCSHFQEMAEVAGDLRAKFSDKVVPSRVTWMRKDLY
jgi:GNAT superfamily N-acetyltransferase